jgi:uncharacterized protein (TIGR01777 family)
VKIAVTGASGFVGRRVGDLARDRGHEVVTVGRTSGDRLWDPAAGPAPLEEVDAVIHLAGEPVTGRWTRSKTARIRESRVLGTRHLVDGLRSSRARVLVSASAIGYYGDRGDEELTEESPPGDDFLARVCREWEAEAMESGVRTACVRVGIALGPGGGALARMLTPFQLGLGGRLGDGLQWMSWVHLDDLAALFLHAVEREDVTGPLLGTAPNPVRNADFTRTLGRVLGRWTILPAPRWGLRLLFGKAADVFLSGQRCRAKRTLQSGFSFAHADLEPALREILEA